MNEIPRNRFKAGLEAGNTLYGLWHSIPDNSVAELLAGSGFDWMVVDHEHGPFELRDVMSQLQAMAPYDVAPIVRPVDDDPALLKKLCDIGVQTFLVPMIDTAEQAAAVVSAVKYPPQGRRGIGTSMARAARWGAIPGYLQQANEEICVIVQVETVTAVENIVAIVNTAGIDGVFFGPSDLSASMGHVGDVSHPEVIEAVSAGLRTVREAGKKCGPALPGRVAGSSLR